MKQNCTFLLAGRRAVILSSISFCFSEPSSSLLNSSKCSPYAFSIFIVSFSRLFLSCLPASCLLFKFYVILIDRCFFVWTSVQHTVRCNHAVN